MYGSVVPVNARDPTKFQHQGFGMLLMEEAERIAREEHGSHKLAVISGIDLIYHNLNNKYYKYYYKSVIIMMHIILFRCRDKKLLSKNGIRTRWAIYVKDAYCLQINTIFFIIKKKKKQQT